MAMVCRICSHPDRLAIDREIVAGQPHTKIAKKYGVSNQSVRNHARSHLSRQLLQSYERKGRMVSDELVDQFEGLFVKARELHEKSLARDSLSGDTLALRALGEQRAILDTMCRILALLVEAKAMEQASQEVSQPLELDISDFSIEERRALVNAYRRKRFGDETPACHVAEPAPKHAPAPKPLPKTDSKPQTGTEIEDPGPYTPEVAMPFEEEEFDEFKPAPPPLPRSKPIPGGGPGVKRRRRMLARKVASRPTERIGRQGVPIPIPGGDEYFK